MRRSRGRQPADLDLAPPYPALHKFLDGRARWTTSYTRFRVASAPLIHRSARTSARSASTVVSVKAGRITRSATCCSPTTSACARAEPYPSILACPVNLVCPRYRRSRPAGPKSRSRHASSRQPGRRNQISGISLPSTCKAESRSRNHRLVQRPQNPPGAALAPSEKTAVGVAESCPARGFGLRDLLLQLSERDATPPAPARAGHG